MISIQTLNDHTSECITKNVLNASAPVPDSDVIPDTKCIEKHQNCRECKRKKKIEKHRAEGIVEKRCFRKHCGNHGT